MMDPFQIEKGFWRGPSNGSLLTFIWDGVSLPFQGRVVITGGDKGIGKEHWLFEKLQGVEKMKNGRFFETTCKVIPKPSANQLNGKQLKFSMSFDCRNWRACSPSILASLC